MRNLKQWLDPAMMERARILMIISGKYELSHALAESSFRSFHARHTVTGRSVMVHFLTGGSASGRSLAEVMAGLNAERQAQLLDAGDHEGTSYLVTVSIDGFTTLQAWLGDSGVTEPSVTMEPPRQQTLPSAQSVAAPSLAMETPRTPTAASSPPSAGDFTQMFGGVTTFPAAPAVSPPTERTSDAGSFTQMFGAPPSKATPVPTGSVPGAPLPPRASEGDDKGSLHQPPVNTALLNTALPARPMATSGAMETPRPPTAVSPQPSAGDFTQMFGGATASPAAPAVPPPTERTADAGSFTQMFGAPPKATPVPTGSVSGAPLPPRATDGVDGGSFTEVFQPNASKPLPYRPVATPTPYHPPGVPPPPGRTADAGEFTHFFKVPEQLDRPAPSFAPQQTPPRAAERAASEFTEFFRGPEVPASFPPPSRLDPPQQPPRRPPVPMVNPLGGATEFFQAPPPLRAATPHELPSMPAVSGPSDFTMMIGGRGASGAAPSAPSTSAPPVSEWPPFSPAPLPTPSVSLPKAPTLPPMSAVEPSAATRRMILIGVLSFVVTLGFMVIVYLVFRSGR